jgi:hypothetical protein
MKWWLPEAQQEFHVCQVFIGRGIRRYLPATRSSVLRLILSATPDDANLTWRLDRDPLEKWDFMGPDPLPYTTLKPISSVS